jgi:hypothetical protein
MQSRVALPQELAWLDERPGPPGVDADVMRFLTNLDRLSEHERTSFLGAMDEVQIRSKLWLIDELSKLYNLGGARLVVIGAWFGILPLLINWQIAQRPRLMTCVDIDSSACDLGHGVIGSLYDNIEYQRADAMDLDYPKLASEPQTIIINTICEHLAQFGAWRDRMPSGQLLVLQSNNYFLCPDHVNTVPSLQAFREQARLHETLFEGILPLSLMDRYMLIGR